jgi:hypothetical protein
MLTAVGVTGRASAVECQRELDVLADQAAQQRVHAADHVVEVEARGLQHLLAAEGEQLPREARGAVGRGGSPRIRARSCCRRAAPRARISALPRIGGEQVVEVVRDAAGQPADASIFCAWRSCSSPRGVLALRAAQSTRSTRPARSLRRNALPPVPASSTRSSSRVSHGAVSRRVRRTSPGR